MTCLCMIIHANTGTPLAKYESVTDQKADPLVIGFCRLHAKAVAMKDQLFAIREIARKAIESATDDTGKPKPTAATYGITPSDADVF